MTVSAAAAEAMLADKDIDEVAEPARTEILNLNGRCSKAARRVGELIKFALHHHGVHDSLIASRFPTWRRPNETEWRSFPSGLRAACESLRTVVPIDEEAIGHIQKYIDDGFEPFVSLRHLHRAQNDDRPWVRWIEATTAAELAIKEYR